MGTTCSDFRPDRRELLESMYYYFYKCRFLYDRMDRGLVVYRGDTASGEVEILEIFVHKIYQNTGVGYYLLREFMDKVLPNYRSMVGTVNLDLPDREVPLKLFLKIGAKIRSADNNRIYLEYLR